MTSPSWEQRALAAEAEAKRLREALERPDMDALIALLDKHADRAMEYLRMNGDAVPTDTDTRAVIWNEMSALMGEYARAALSDRGSER